VAGDESAWHLTSPKTHSLKACRRSLLFSPEPLPKSLRGDAQGTVELARRVLPSDHRRELDERVVAEEATDPREQVVGNVAVREGDGVGVLQRRLLLCVVGGLSA